jgi:parvulin-like peptidyl-prolyl isomerase
MLRALVRGRAEVRPDQVELAWRVRHGERVRIRVLVTATEREAQAARRELSTVAGTELESRFITLAERDSTDASAPRGGLIEQFSTSDPAYEAPIRTAAEGLQPGQLSPIVAIRSGYAIIYMDERIPADGVSLDEARERLASELGLRQERILMDELATQLLADARVTTFDESLTWSRNVSNP